MLHNIRHRIYDHVYLVNQVLLRKSWYENSLIMGGLRKSSQITLVVKFANLLSVKPMQVSLRLRLDRR